MQLCAKKEKNVDTHMEVIIKAMKATTRAGAISVWVLSFISTLTEASNIHVLWVIKNPSPRFQ